MTKDLKYFDYLIRHKYFVFVAGLKFKVPLWRLLIHDWSKFRYWTEWVPYRELFYNVPSAEARQAFQLASLRHIKLNKHHWNYWIAVAGGRGDQQVTLRAHEMPEVYIREMVADWYGAGRAVRGIWSAREWYEENKDHMLLDIKTRAIVEQFLAIDVFQSGDGQTAS